MDDNEQAGRKEPTPEQIAEVVEAGHEIARSVFRDWAEVITKGMAHDAAAGYLTGIEVGLHMAMHDETAAFMAALVIDFAVHDGATLSHETAAEVIAVLRALSAGRIGIVNEVGARIDAMRPDAPPPGDVRNN